MKLCIEMFKHNSCWQASQQQETEGEDYSADQYGLMPLIQSAVVIKRDFVDVKQLEPSLADSTVWIRGRLHTSRAKGIIYRV